MKVHSTNIRDIEYDAKTQTLSIMFKSGRTYQYLNVPQIVYDRFEKSPSKGEFFATSIKDAYSTLGLN